MSFYRSGTDPGKRKGPADDNGAFANKWICSSVVILQTQVRDQVFAHDVAQRVLQFHRLNEQIVLWIETFSRLWRLEIKAQPLLDADGAQFWRSLGEVEEQHEVRGDWRGQD